MALILNWNGGTLTEDAALSVRDQVTEVMIVDNASTPAELHRLRAFAQRHGVTLVENERNLGYAAGNNVGIHRALCAGFDAVLIMNNDAAAEPGAVRLLMQRLSDRADLAAVGPTVVEMDNPEVVVHTGCLLRASLGNTGWLDRGTKRAGLPAAPFRSEAISGAAFLARASALRDCGAFDERFGFYFEDTEWSARVQRSGWRLEVVPRSFFRHALGGSMPSMAGEYFRARNRPIYFRVGLKYSRIRAAASSAPPTMVTIASLLRRKHLRLAFRAVLLGWVIGVVVPDRRRRLDGVTAPMP